MVGADTNRKLFFFSLPLFIAVVFLYYGLAAQGAEQKTPYIPSADPPVAVGDAERATRLRYCGSGRPGAYVYRTLDQDDWDEIKNAARPLDITFRLVDFSSNELTQIKGNTAIERLSIQQCSGLTDEDVETIASLPNLNTLVLAAEDGLRDPDLSKLADLKLKTLWLEVCVNLSEESLMKLSNIQTLTNLSLARCKQTTSRVVSEIGKLEKLTVLNLDGCEFLTKECVSDIARLSFLTRISLNGCASFDDDCMKELAFCHSLKSASLRGCYKVTEKGLDELKNLRFVSFFPPEQFFADDKIGNFATKFSYLPSLEIGSDPNSPISLTDEGLEKLSIMKNLKALYVRYCPRVTPEAIDALRKEIPRATIVFDGAAARFPASSRPISSDLKDVQHPSRLQFKGRFIGTNPEYRRLSAEDWNAVRDAKFPTDLEFSMIEFSGDELSRLNGNGAVRALAFNRCRHLSDDVLDVLASLPNLKSVSLKSNDELIDLDFSQLSVQKITTLCVENCANLSEKSFATIQTLGSIENLSLKNCQHFSDVALAGIGNLENLSSLAVNGDGKISDRGVAELSGLTRLRSLLLTGRLNITDDGAATVARISSLRVLSMKGCGLLTAKGLNSLAKASLLYFDPPSQFYSDENIESLTQAFPNLTILDISSGDGESLPLTNEGLKKLGKMNNLRRVFLADCPNVTQGGIAALNELLPDCQVIQKRDLLESATQISGEETAKKKD